MVKDLKTGDCYRADHLIEGSFDTCVFYIPFLLILIEGSLQFSIVTDNLTFIKIDYVHINISRPFYNLV